MVDKKIIRTPLGQRLKRIRVGALPFLVWVGSAYLVSMLWLDIPKNSTFVGLAHSREAQVLTPVSGLVTELLVSLYESVEAGDPIAVIDDASLRAKIETARAELHRMHAEVDAQRATIESEAFAADREALTRHDQAVSTVSLEYPAELRAFYSDEASLEVSIMETRLAITASQHESERIAVRLQRAKKLANREVGPEADVIDLEGQHSKELAQGDSLRQVLSRLERELAKARKRRTALRHSYLPPPPTTVFDPMLEARLSALKSAIQVQQRALDELALECELYTLRAPGNGQITSLTAVQGQFLAMGAEVALLSSRESHDVIMWIPESTGPAPLLGTMFAVSTELPSRENRVLEISVRATSPRLELMPERLWRDARIAEYGQAVLIGPTDALGLRPGERVRIDPLVN